jgi:hypothetical protein
MSDESFANVLIWYVQFEFSSRVSLITLIVQTQVVRTRVLWVVMLDTQVPVIRHLMYVMSRIQKSSNHLHVKQRECVIVIMVRGVRVPVSLD